MCYLLHEDVPAGDALQYIESARHRRLGEIEQGKDIRCNLIRSDLNHLDLFYGTTAEMFLKGVPV
jgi:hypothetical protein